MKTAASMQEPEESKNKRSDMSEKLLTLEELAEKLQVSRTWLYSRTGQRKIPGMVKIGRYCRFDPIAINEWIEDLKNNRKDAK